MKNNGDWRKGGVLKLKMTAFLLALLLALPGCAAIRQFFDRPDIDTKTAEVNKVNAYIWLNNELMGSFDEDLTAYYTKFGWNEKIDISEGFDGLSLLGNNAAKLFGDALLLAGDTPEMPGADRALMEMDPLLSEYCAVLGSAKKYYDNKDYVDDGFAKAQEYHTIIVSDGEIRDKINVFLNEVTLMLEGKDQETLEFYKNSDMPVHYCALKTLMAAEDMLYYLENNEITGENLLEINIDEFRLLYDDFTKKYNEYDKLVGGDAGAGKPEGIYSLAHYSGNAAKVKRTASELIVRVQSEKGFIEDEIRYCAEGTPENLRKLVRLLLEDYNSKIVK